MTKTFGSGAQPEEFTAALNAMQMAPLRPEVSLTPTPSPSRIAPYSTALSAEVTRGEEELASGRFVLLHDPECPTAWEGPWRAVTFSRAELEPELARDPMLGNVGWSWLMEALAERGAEFTAPAGTVTQVVSQGFGELQDQRARVEIEIRASWTPIPGRIEDHLLAWTDALSTIGGLPPLPEGVAVLPGRHA